MLNVDEFESVFRAADKKKFVYDPPAVARILVVADLEGEDLDEYVKASRALLEPVTAAAERAPEWDVKGAGTWEGVEGVLRLVEDGDHDAVVTCRNLNSDAWQWAYSLGIYLNALTRGTQLPVFVTPNPRAYPSMAWRHNRTDSVMAINDSLVGDDLLVSWAARATRDGGKLHLTHMEHDEIFERYIAAISKIPEIDTDTARETLLQQLLREPKEWIATARAALEEAGEDLTVVEHVLRGHRVADYRAIIEEHEVDLVVFPTLEEDRIALHGVAYSLAVELVETPLLMV
jgi:nucleotide-binding universal stress UspA family protein